MKWRSAALSLGFRYVVLPCSISRSLWLSDADGQQVVVAMMNASSSAIKRAAMPLIIYATTMPGPMDIQLANGQMQ